MAGTTFSLKLMTHEQVIDRFINGQRALGTYVRASEDRLYSRIPHGYSPYGNPAYGTPRGQTTLAVRLQDGSILANGAQLGWPMRRHQTRMLQALEDAQVRFSVIPFHSIIAALTDGKEQTWSEALIPIDRLQKDVSVVVPSAGEHWKEVVEKDDKGVEHTSRIHTLGDSVVRISQRFYVSSVDPTGTGAGMYFLAELPTDRAPQSVDDALNLLKPPAVREAEARGSNVRRQGEWFAVPTERLTSELMRDVESGIAVYGREHTLGRDGHHTLQEAVVYRAGSRKGEVYARGVMQHTRSEHDDLDLGRVRWYRIVHNIGGPSYTLSGSGKTAQFD